MAEETNGMELAQDQKTRPTSLTQEACCLAGTTKSCSDLGALCAMKGIQHPGSGLGRGSELRLLWKRRNGKTELSTTRVKLKETTSLKVGKSQPLSLLRLTVSFWSLTDNNHRSLTGKYKCNSQRSIPNLRSEEEVMCLDGLARVLSKPPIGSSPLP